MGGKSVNIDSKFQLEKCDDTHQNTGDDWLSRLPDDILVGVLSTLPLKEAARTSILSPRWENLWKHTLHLNFDADSALCRIVRHSKNTKIRTAERRKYLNWVNKVIRSYKGFALKELRIGFDLDKSSAQKAINRWLRFAFERRVESCPLLEHLVIDSASKISKLNICGALALKHLEISHCGHIESLRISAPNLISLMVTNAEALLLENVPKLVDLNICCFNEKVHKLVPALYCCLSQLEILTLELYPKKELMDKYSKCEFHALPKLKKLEILFNAEGDQSMIGLTSLIRAAPYIQELIIRMKWYKLLRTRTNVKNDIHSPHQHLKVVKFLGYYGRASDIELVRYLLDNCVVLEKLIIDPRYQPSFLYAPIVPDEEFDGLVVDRELTRRKKIGDGIS